MLSRKYDVCIDRGTYDAISLTPNDSDSVMKTYIENVYKVTTEGGYFVITSCNWTEEELIEHCLHCEFIFYVYSTG